MRFSRFAFVALLALIGLASWVLLGSPRPAEDARRAATGGSGQPDAAAGEDASAAAADAGAIARSEAEAAAAGGDEGAEFSGPRLIVRVLDLIQRKPLPGATIWIFDAERLGEEGLSVVGAEGEDLEAAAPRLAVKRIADARGEVILPQPKRWLRLLGRFQGLYGEAYTEAGADGMVVKLLLEKDLSLRARAVNAAGAGVPQIELGLRMRRQDNAHWRLVRTCDTEGRVVFRHLQRALASRNPGETLELVPAMPALDPPRIVLDLARLPEEEQLIVVPAVASVTVRLFDPDRRPAAPGARVTLQAQRGEPPEWLGENGFRPSDAGGSRTLRAEGGEVRFPFVGLGLPLEIGVDFDGTDNPERTLAPGPTEPGQNLVIEVMQGVLRPTLKVRVLDAAGAPLINADLAVSLRSTSAANSSLIDRSGTTDADGVLRFTLLPNWIEGRPEETRQIEVVADAPPDGRALAGILPVRGAWRPGENDLGDLRLEALRVLAGGRVVDEAGAPIIHARVRLARQTMRRNRENWVEDPSTESETDHDGRFSVTGFPRDDLHRLQVRHPDYVQGIATWRPYAEDHVITLQGGRFLLGRVLLDASIPLNSIQLMAVPRNSSAEEPRQRGLRGFLSRSGDFRCGPGVEEECDLWVWDNATDRLLLSVEGLAAGPADGPMDPRLDPLDLRGVLRLVRVRWAATDGLPVPGVAQYSIQRSLEEPKDFTSTSDTSEFLVLSADEDWTIWIKAYGFRPASARLRGDEVDVALQPGPRVLWRFADPGVLTIGKQAWLELSWEDKDGDRQSHWQSTHEDQSQALEQPGTYSVRLFLRTIRPDGRHSWLRFPNEGYRVIVQDRSGEQLVVLPWTVAEIQAALGDSKPL